MTMARETLFRPKPRELIWDAFLQDQGRYFNHELASLIDEFFHRFFVEFICGLYPVVEKTSGAWRAKVIESLVTSYPLLDEAAAVRRLPALTAHEPSPDLRAEMAVFLEIMRESYCAFIQGPKGFCWERAAPVIERDSHVCPAHDRCWGDSHEAMAVPERARCVRYTLGWGGTELAIRSWEFAGDSPLTLAQGIYQKCPLLKLVADPAGLRSFLQEQYFSDRGSAGQHRTSRGAVVRVLSALGDHCLEDLNSRLALTGEAQLAFLKPPAPDPGDSG